MKPEMFTFLLIASVLAAAHGELPPMACLQEELQMCAKTLELTDFLKGCTKIGDLETCLKNAATTCKVTDVADDLIALMQVLKDICNPLSKLFMEFAKSYECLDKFARTSLVGSPCIKKIMELYERDGLSDEARVLKLTLEICETHSTVLNCLFGEVEKACQKDAKDAVATVLRPVNNLLTTSCKESGFGDEDSSPTSGGGGKDSSPTPSGGGEDPSPSPSGVGGGGGGAGTSALSWALLAAASLLFVLWH